jgi:RNA polymerase sigma-70 factor (ECF subfamily)
MAQQPGEKIRSDERAARPVRATLLSLANAPADAELLRRIVAGDRWAEEALFRRYVELVGATAMRMLRNRAEAEDVVQETFLIAFQHIARLRDPEALRGWLVRIALSRVHRRFRFHRLRSFLGLSFNSMETLEEAASDEASNEDRAELALIDQGLLRLKASEREVWLLRHAVGCSLEEVASASGCSLATAKRRLRVAEDRVARLIQKGEPRGGT